MLSDDRTRDTTGTTRDVTDLLIEEFASDVGIQWPVLLLRLAGALVLAGVVGLERELDGRPAGLRTHMLTGLAACVYCLVMLSLVYSFADREDQVRLDPIRIVESVTQGVAFLAAGIVVFTRGEVRGLTTGASMWLAAAIGLACGLGLWLLATATTILALTVIRLVKVGERAMGTYEEQQPGPNDDTQRSKGGGDGA